MKTIFQYEIVRLECGSYTLPCSLTENDEDALVLNRKKQVVTPKYDKVRNFFYPVHEFNRTIEPNVKTLTKVVRDYEIWMNGNISKLVMAGAKTIYVGYHEDFNFLEISTCIVNKTLDTKMIAKARMGFWGYIPKKSTKKVKR